MVSIVQELAEQVYDVAGALFRREWSEGTLAQTKCLIDGRYSGQLVLTLMNLSAEEPCAAMTAVMELLESIALIDFSLAGALMVPLYDHADAAFLHEINNAIDLWMYENRSPALAAHIRQMAHDVDDPALRKHYSQWVETLDLPPGSASCPG